MIPNFKTYIKESIWTNINKRSEGNLERQEDIGNKKSVKELARKVVDALKSYGFQSDFSDDINLESPDNSSFYASTIDAFDIELEKGIYAGMIIFNKDTFSYAFNICVPYGLYVCDTPLQINDYESASAWIDFCYGDEDDYEAEEMEPAAFYYNPEKDEWICTDLHDPNEVGDGKWVKRIMSIVAHVVNPNSKIK